ncbi:MAG TPA: deoxynucleoside kinase [Bacteroidetes bacterium]|nr:deoxynucleoside kinase [Bacteroidota bacterium]
MAKKKSKPKAKPAAKPKSKPAAKKSVKTKVAKSKKSGSGAAAKAKPQNKSKAAAKKSSKKKITQLPSLAKPKPEKLKYRHIAIAGNIGAGKSTLTKLLSDYFKWEPQFEDVENNPYLMDFYDDMPRWSFNLQVFFLNSRFSQIIGIQRGDHVVIQDRTIYEDAQIFAPNLHAMGLMNRRDFENYTNLFQTINQLINPPDLLIYLRGSISTLVSQIEKRGREYEDNLRLDYLRRLNEHYEAWISQYKAGPLLIIDIDKLNFADKKDHLNQVVNSVKAELKKLFG